MTTRKTDIGDGPRAGDDDREGGQPVAPLDARRKVLRADPRPPGCACDPDDKPSERCNKSGWVRCNARLQWLHDEALRHGLDGKRDMNWRTNKPKRRRVKA